MAAQGARANSSSGVRGPERFFYDKSSYTGVHTRGGPSTIDKNGASQYSDLSEMTRSNLRGARGGSTRLSGGGAGEVRTAAAAAPTTVVARRGSGSGDGLRSEQPAPTTVVARRGSGSGEGLRGPERFFYDKSTYTGTHTNGGPTTIDTGAGGKVSDLKEITRPPSKEKRPSSANRTVPTPTPARTSSKGTAGQSGQLRGPERFFYDKSSYTGVHNNGGPSTIDRHNVGHLSQITRPHLN